MNKYYLVHCDKIETVFLFTKEEEKEAAQVFNALTTITNTICNFEGDSAYILYPSDSDIPFFEWSEGSDEIFCWGYDSLEEISKDFNHVMFHGDFLYFEKENNENE